MDSYSSPNKLLAKKAPEDHFGPTVIAIVQEARDHYEPVTS